MANHLADVLRAAGEVGQRHDGGRGVGRARARGAAVRGGDGVGVRARASRRAASVADPPRPRPRRARSGGKGRVGVGDWSWRRALGGSGSGHASSSIASPRAARSRSTRMRFATSVCRRYAFSSGTWYSRDMARITVVVHTPMSASSASFRGSPRSRRRASSCLSNSTAGCAPARGRAGQDDQNGRALELRGAGSRGRAGGARRPRGDQRCARAGRPRSASGRACNTRRSRPSRRRRSSRTRARAGRGCPPRPPTRPSPPPPRGPSSWEDRSARAAALPARAVDPRHRRPARARAATSEDPRRERAATRERAAARPRAGVGEHLRVKADRGFGALNVHEVRTFSVIRPFQWPSSARRPTCARGWRARATTEGRRRCAPACSRALARPPPRARARTRAQPHLGRPALARARTTRTMTGSEQG